MKIYMGPNNLNYFEALASNTRMLIIQLLSEQDMNIKELADALNISSSIITKHIRKLESAGLITTANVSKDGSRQKVCTLLNMVTEVQAPFKNNRGDPQKKLYETSLPIGQFIDCVALPPCGLACEERVIGNLDEPVQMLCPERVGAQLLWMGEGYVEYMVPNYLQKKQRLTELEISGEFGSEATGYNDNWPSTIAVTLNGKKLCSFTTPGDLGSTPGTYTPRWWPNNQYGILVVIRVSESGVYVNGEKKSSVTVSDLDCRRDRWTLRLTAGASSVSGGGLTIFGEKYGNYNQNLLFRTFYD